MGWTKVSESRWERPMDGLESYFAVMGNITSGFCDGREHYTLFSKVRLEPDSPDAETSLRRAWRQLRHEQPQIAATFEGLNKIYEVPDETAIQEWLAATFIVSSASDALELHQDVTDKPICEATMHYLPKSSELVFRGHHHCIDGTGVLLLWHSYLSALASPAEDTQFGDEPARLAPAMGEVLGFPEQPTKEKSYKATEILISWLTNVPGVGPASRVGTAPAGKCQNTEVVISADTTAALVQSCNDQGVTVTAAVHAAYVAAVVKHATPDSKMSEYVSMTQFDLRRYLPEPYSSSKHAVSVYYAPLPYRIGLPASFWDIARSLHEYYQISYRNNPELMELRDHYMRSVCGVIQTPEFLASPVPRDALVSSNLGIAERYVQREYAGGTKVLDLQLGVDIILGMSMLFLYTFRDQLRLVYSFNDGYEDPKDIQVYLEEMQNILADELLTDNMVAWTLNLFAASGLLKLATATVFPVPDTPFRVTWESVELTDPDRPDPFNETHVRRLMISTFAPVPISECLEICRVPYMSEIVATSKDDQLEEFLDVLLGGEGAWPRGLFADTELEICCEVGDYNGGAGYTEALFPTILFGPGLNASRLDYSGFAQHIAGMGYNVVVMDHPYDANIVEFPDGTIIPSTELGEVSEDALLPFLDARAADVTLVLDSLGFTDANSVIAIGHSFGGAASAVAVAKDNRVAGGVNLDGALYGPVVSDGVERPFFILGSENNNSSASALESWDRFITATQPRGTWIRELNLEGSLHWSLVDWSIIGDVYGLRDDEDLHIEVLLGRILGSRVAEVLREYLSDFVDFVFEDEGEGLLEGPSDQFSEVKFLL
ncbi:uncharacterized protein DNG_07405 [Cephalotrichum gorgonifer]|uniref:1-alkyl-2-acetylglycerophosphocholine esterase n=1 Tax=Cephalotrichum gorgonifer TaxID=2041049 RepID=A0AAE8N4J1_9PEZI|nr:uncharacterized protein DNG_07405 [Cephalotrichum gorgonifer]